MAKAILKYFLKDRPTDEPQMLPSGKVLHVGHQGSALCIWIEAEPGAPNDREFRVAWTGYEAPPPPFTHLATSIGSVLVCHVFAKPI